MPNRDATGPDGQGANTGRGIGDCKNNIQPQNIDRGCSRRRTRKMQLNALQGMARGVGRGRGCGKR